MKKFTSLLLSTAMLGGMASAMPAKALEPPMYSVMDVVLLQKYLHGKASLSESTFHRYDANGDGMLNVYDWILVKQYLLNSQKEIELTEAYSDVIPEADCTPFAWLMGLQKDPVISTSAQQLESNMKSMFPEEFVSTLTERYDEDFFKEHDLILDFRIQGEEPELLTFSNGFMTEDTINLYYYRAEYSGLSETGILLTQVVVPKITHQYQFNMSIGMETEIPYEFTTGTQDGEFDQPVVIATYEQYQSIDLPEEFSGYTEEFFDTKVLMIYADAEGYPQGSQRYGYSAAKLDDTVTITVVQNTTDSDTMVPFADFLVFNKEDIRNMKFTVKTIRIHG